jgi:hypothetical protein
VARGGGKTPSISRENVSDSIVARDAVDWRGAGYERVEAGETVWRPLFFMLTPS